MNTHRSFPRGTARCALYALFALPAALAIGQTAAAPGNPKPEEETLKLEKFVVTGSNIPMPSDVQSVPVTVIGQADIEKTGLSANLQEILQKRLPMISGNGNLGTTAANTNSGLTSGGSQLSVRNLTTLVLINGRRISDNGAGGNGNRNFVDVSQIPVAGIERVEVLTDGASAIYGSDAIGGVVNVILRSNYQGFETGGRYGFSEASGKYRERSAFAVGGVANDKMGVTVALNWNKVDPLLQNDRAISGVITGRTATYSGVVGVGAAFPTAMLAPGVNSARDRNPVGLAATATSLADLLANGTYVPATFASAANALDLAPYVTLVIGREIESAYVNTFAKLAGDQLEFFGDFLHSKTTSMSQLAAQPSTPNLNLPAGSPYNPLTVAFTPVAFRYLPAPRIFENESVINRYNLGVRGRVGSDWSWEAAYNYNKSKLIRETRNVLYAPNINRAVAGGFNSSGTATPGGAFSRVITGFSESSTTFVTQPALDGTARASAIDPASMANILGTARGEFFVSNKQLDAKVSGVVYELPAGKIRFAAGADFRTESLTGVPDENSRSTGPTARRWLGATFFDYFMRERNVTSAFGEIRVPLAGEGWRAPGLNHLELDFAYRSEDYSDAGRSNVPKYGLVWRPLDETLTVRYSYSESFVAPTLYALFGPTTQGFTAQSIIPSVFGVNGQAQQQTGSNPTLRPSTAESSSLGFSWAPKQVKNLSISMDYLEVEQIDLTSTLGAGAILQDVNNRGSASSFANQVAFSNFPGLAGSIPITTPGQIAAYLAAGNSANGIYVFDGNQNIAGQRVQALDINVNYLWRSESLGTFDLTSTGTFFLKFEFQATPFERFYQFAGHTSANGVSAQGTIPGYRFYNTVAWHKGNWNATIGHTYIPAVVDIGTGGSTFVQSATARRIAVPSYSTVDLSLGYTVPPSLTKGWMEWVKGMRVTVGVNNLGDKQPPLAPQAWTDNNADVSTYNPIGRLWYVSAGLKF